MEENARMDLRNSGRYTQNLEFLTHDIPFDGFHVKNDGGMNENQKNSKFVSENESKVLSDRGSNISKYKLMSPARLPISRSPCLTIPTGLSPTTLLDSPVLLSNLKAEPSPTTGTFYLPPLPHDSRTSPLDRSNITRIDDESNAIKINPHIKLSLGSGLSSLDPTASVSNYNQCKPDLQVQQSFQFETNPSISSNESTVPNLNLAEHTDTSCDKMTTDNVANKAESDDGIQVLQSDQKAINVVAKGELSLEDGYNWRKYGQKLVKGSEFPRSYYKCTHPNCQVKKQMERSFDGHITEITYKGKHDHPKPQANRRMATGAMFSSQEEERYDGFCSLVGEEDRLTISHSKDSRNEANCNVTLSPVSASDDEVEGSCPQTNKDSEALDDDDGDNSESKRRKTDLSSMDASLMAKSNREPRVVVQTMSEVDILDDGYRWRKYGQKVVKGNPNPRSYYKCTNAGCPVRKHVERASHDPKAVITTYEGKHNHDVPSLRNSTPEQSQPTTINSFNGSRIQASTSMNGGIRIDDSTCTFPHFCELSKEQQPISLQLGVGVIRGPENQPITDGDRNNGSVCRKVVQATSILPYYGILGSNILPRHASRDQVEGFGLGNTPINPSSNQISKEHCWAIANGSLME